MPSPKMTKVSERVDRLAASERLLVAQPGTGVHVNYLLVPVTKDNVTNGRRRLLIQADTLFVVQADMEQGGAAPAYADIDVPSPAIALADMDVGDRAARGPQRRQFTF